MSKTISRLTCSFCQKNQDEVKKLIAGPGVYVCNECVQQCNERLLTTRGQSLEPPDHRIKCSFCGKSQAQVTMLLDSPSKEKNTRICDECVDLCNDILSEELFDATPTSPPGKRAVRIEGPSMMGTLEDLPPARLLQELAVANKTGILTVQADEGKLINIVLLSGKPIYARVATVNSKGREAMNEFLASQKQGSFVFLDKSASEAFYREVHHVSDAECEIKKEDA